MASPERFRFSSPRRQHQTAASPFVISSSPDLPLLWNTGPQLLRPPVFKPSAPSTPTRLRSQAGLTPAADCEEGAVSLSSSPKYSVHPSHYKIANKAATSAQTREDDIAPTRATKGTESPSALGVSPTRALSKTDSETAPSSKAVDNGTCSKKITKKNIESGTLEVSASKQAKEESLNLERALMRRMDWTPPKQKAPVCIELDNSDPVVAQPNDDEAETTTSFTEVLHAFKCSGKSNSAKVARSEREESVFRKRKLIEPVSTKIMHIDSEKKNPAQTKAKAVKKKPRTITDLAMAAYKPVEHADEPSAAATLSGKANDTIVTMGAEVAQNSTATKTKKRVTKPKVKKKKPPPKPVLLAPSAALQQAANQFLFGTSSQLAQGHSPRSLRNLVGAMGQLNEIDCIDLATPINSDAIEPSEPKRSLWDAAARDEDGDLFDTKLQELVQKSPALPAPAAQTDPFGYVKKASPAQDVVFLNLSDVLQPATENSIASKKNENSTVGTSSASSSEGTGPTTTMSASPKRAPCPKFEVYTDAQLANAVSSYGFKNVRQRTARIALLEKCWQGKNQSGCVSGLRAASSLSPSKARSPSKTKRGKAVAKKTSSSSESSFFIGASQPQEPPPSAQPTSPPPKRPRGRPRKTPTPTEAPVKPAPPRAVAPSPAKRAARAPSTPKRARRKASPCVVEIPDSESDDLGELLASPGSVSLDECSSPLKAIDLSLSVEEDGELSASVGAADKPDLFEYIGRAITSAPRTNDADSPSWYEKILLYDPIVLEDLAAWLNCGPLTEAGYDDEVSTAEVKQWCESKSICCLWRVNLRGKERKKF